MPPKDKPSQRDKSFVRDRLPPDGGIDRTDTEILRLINHRLNMTREGGEVNTPDGANVPETANQAALLDQLVSLNPGPLTPQALRRIFTEIISASRAIRSPLRVTYLGPEATFTHQAALQQFGGSTTFVPQTTIRDIFRSVDKGDCLYGVVPVENSIEGSVNFTLDLLFESSLKIVAETYLSISHDLLSPSGRLDQIRKVYSHPHAFAQCRKWLRQYLPACPLQECSSTAEAARRASLETDVAAIASRAAGEMYALQIVVGGIEDVTRNVTRFLVIGRDEMPPTGNDKTSIMLVTSHVPGALYRVLKPMAEAGINMVKLESRPTKHENWSYFFFVEIEGHVETPEMQEALGNMRNLSLFLKHLGSYPRVRPEIAQG